VSMPDLRIKSFNGEIADLVPGPKGRGSSSTCTPIYFEGGCRPVPLGGPARARAAFFGRRLDGTSSPPSFLALKARATRPLATALPRRWRQLHLHPDLF